MRPASFKTLFVATQCPGVNYYRMASFAKYMDAEIWPQQSLEALANWEEILPRDATPLYDLEKYVGRANIVVWQRLSTWRGLATVQGMKAKHHKKMLVEFDDDVLRIDSSNPGWLNCNPETDSYKVFAKQLNISDGAIVSTEPLRKFYKNFNKKVEVIRNSIDFDMWNVKYHKHDKIVIGWQGGAHHYNDLALLMPVIPGIIKKYPKVEFHFFGMLPFYLKDTKGCIFYDPVPIKDYPKKMGEINPDIIVAPLADNNMNQARSNLRVLEAGAMKKPVVATANKKLPYAGIIEDGVNGLLAKNTDEWVKKLSVLIENAGVRNKLGNALFNTVKKDYSIKNEAKHYDEILRKF